MMLLGLTTILRHLFVLTMLGTNMKISPDFCPVTLISCCGCYCYGICETLKFHGFETSTQFSFNAYFQVF